MSKNLEEVAEEYQTYRVLSEDSDFTLPITNVVLVPKNRCYLEIAIDEQTFYLEIKTTKQPPHMNYAVLEEIVTKTPVTPESLCETNITVNIDSNLDTGTIKTDIGNLTVQIYDEITEPPATNDTEDWQYLDEKCSISYWYHTTEKLEEEKARQSQIQSIKEVTNSEIRVTVNTHRYDTIFSIPKPENANKNDNFTAEFIEDCSGDIRLLDDSEIVLVPQNTDLKTNKTGFNTEDKFFTVYSLQQYSKYIHQYETGQKTSKSNTETNKNQTDSSMKMDADEAIQLGGINVFLFIILNGVSASMSNLFGEQFASTFGVLIESLTLIFLVGGFLLVVFGFLKKFAHINILSQL